MYGTIARMRVRPGSAQAVVDWAENEGDQGAGFVRMHVYQMDGIADELWASVVFRDRASYRANAESPEQDARFRRLRALLVEDPEWHDGEIVYSVT